MSANKNLAVALTGIVALLLIVVLVPWDNRSPDPALAVSQMQYSDAIHAPAEATVFPQVLSVSDAAVRDGLWYVLDSWGTQVHRVDPADNSVRTFGRRGEGPGELDRPRGIVLHGDSIMVFDFHTLRVFGLDGQHYGDRVIVTVGCRIEDGISVSDTLLLLIACTIPNAVAYHAVVENDDASPVRLASHTIPIGVAVERVVIGPHPDGFLFGHPYDDCMRLYAVDGSALGEECHEWIERIPVPEPSDDMKEVIADLERKARQSGTRLQWPEHMSPFQQVSMTSTGRLVYRAPAPDDGSVNRLLMRAATGEQVVQSVVAPILFADGDRVLAAWEVTEGARLLFADLSPIP